MDSTTISNLPASVQVFLIMIGLWIFNQYWQDRKDKGKSQEDALSKNTLALIELQIQVKNLTEVLSILPKMRADIDAAHEKLRDGQAKNNI